MAAGARSMRPSLGRPPRHALWKLRNRPRPVSKKNAGDLSIENGPTRHHDKPSPRAVFNERNTMSTALAAAPDPALLGATAAASLRVAYRLI
jgi:hypothetical protein